MGENSIQKVSFLPLVSLSSKMHLSDEQLLNYSIFFNIPSQRHSLVGQLKKLANISKILHCLVPSQYKYLVYITGFLITNRKDPLVQQVIISKQTGERSGLASTIPLYDALQKIPDSKTTNIFELILGLAFAIQDLRPDISPNPSLKSNLISISRTIRKQSKKSNPFFSRLIEIEIVSNELSEIYTALATYLEIVESEITPELKSLIQYFQTDKTGIVPHAFDESINSVQSNEPSERIRTNVKDRQLLERFSSQSTNKTRSSESRIFAILPINNQAAVNSEGTIQEDVVENDEIIENKTIDGESLSAAGNRVSARAVQQKGVMQSQFCKYRWERLSATEKKIILSEALNSDSIGATCAILTMSFGAEPLVWGEFKIGNQDDMNPYINLNTYVWGHPIKQHENSWIPVSEQEELLYSAKNFITLKVPVSVINKLSKLNQVKAKTISGLLGFNPEQLNIELKTWLLSLHPRNRELTIAKLREELYSTIMDQAMDEVAAHMICTQPTYLLPIQSFYTAISEGKLNAIYDSALFDIFTTKQGCDLVGSPLSGSKLQVKEHVILDLVERLKNQVKSCSPKSFIEYHNAFTVYTYLLFSYATGHRLVVDPFAKKRDFIEQSKAVVVYDKETDLNHTGRLCALGDVAWEQYINYKAHLVELSNRVYSENKKLRSKILDCLDGKETLPFLFLLERDNNEIKILSIREKTLSLHLHGWQLPFNTQRHYLSSNLRALNVNSEIIDYQLGHFQNGTQELGFASTLSLDKVSDYLGPFLDRLLSNIGFQPLESVLRANKVPIKRIKTGKIDLGYKQRLQKRCERKQRAHSVIKNELQELTARLIEVNFSASNGDFQQLANVLIDKCLQRVLEHKDTLHKGQALRLFYGVLKRIIQKNKLKLKIDFSFSKVSSDPSPVNSHTGHQYHQFLIIRKIFLNNTCKILELEKTKGLDYLMAFSLLTEVIFGRLHNQAWVNNYCNSISQGMLFKEDQVVINLRSTKRSEAIFRYVCSWEGALFLSARKVNFEDLKDLNQSDLIEKQTNLIELCNGILKSLPLPIDLQELSLKKLLKISKSADVIELPGVLRAICNGDINTYSIKSKRYESLRIAQPMEMDTQDDEDSNRVLNTETRFFTPTQADYSATKAIQKEIRQLLDNRTESQQDGPQKYRLTKQINHALNDCKEDLYPIYYYLLEWGLELLSEKSGKGKRRAKVTNKKIHSNSNGLIETFRELDLTQLTDNDFIEAYNQVIQFYPSFQGATPQVIKHVVELKEFHEFLVESFGVAEIDFADLDLPESLSSYLVSANYIGFQEYRLILEALRKDPDASEAQRYYQSVAFCLGFNFGLRSNELFSLSIKDIQIIQSPEFLGTLTTQPSRHGILKTEASKRNLPLHIWLDGEEIAIINELLNIRLQQGAAPDSPVFGWYQEQYVADISGIKKRVVQAMRHITGDSTLNMHHLRHSFATWMAVALIGMPNYCLDRDDLKIKAVRANFDFSLSRRGLFQLAEFMGHAHPSTTIINYIHGFDDWLQKLQKSTVTDFNDYALVSVITGVKYATLRQWKSRSKDESSLAEICMHRLFKEADSKEKIRTDYQTELPPLTNSQQPFSFSFQQLQWFVIRYPILNNLQNASQALFCMPEDVKDLMLSFEEVGTISGYIPESMSTLFQNQTSTTGKDIIGRYLQNIPDQNVDTNWVENFERALLKNPTAQSQIEEMLSIWIKYVYPNETSWKFEKESQLELFVKALNQTKVEYRSMLIRGNYEQISSSVFKKLKKSERPCLHNSKLARTYFAFNPEKIDLELMVVNSENRSIVRTMNFFLFLASARCNFRSKKLERKTQPIKLFSTMEIPE